MELKNGYKQTEVGLVPNNWTEKYINEICSIAVGKDLLTANFSSYKDAFYQYPVYSNTVSDEGIYGFYDISEYDGPAITVVGRGVGLGKAFKRIGSFGAIGRLIVLKPNSSADFRFLTYVINHKVKIHFESGGIPQLTGVSFGKYKVPLPPTREEQTAIATALSDTDALISRLESLIAKKRAIKQGAMQQLLKPKDGWEVKTLGEICSPSKGRINPLLSTENYKCIELEHLSQESGRLLGFANSTDLKSQKTIFQKRDVLFGKLRPYLKKYFFAEFDGVCTTEIWVLKAVKGIDSRWLYYLVQSDRIIEAANLSTGTKMPRAEWKTVSGTLIYLPTPKEQTRMAKILSDMDAEIAGLEQKLAKYKLVKQGMMQELLTGKTRLV